MLKGHMHSATFKCKRPCLSVNQLLFGLTTTIDVETTTPTTVNSTPATTAARRLATPRKKSRKLSSQHLLAGKSSSSSSHHLLARPCLDFEKMQQVNVAPFFYIHLHSLFFSLEEWKNGKIEEFCEPNCITRH